MTDLAKQQMALHNAMECYVSEADFHNEDRALAWMNAREYRDAGYEIGNRVPEGLDDLSLENWLEEQTEEFDASARSLVWRAAETCIMENAK